MSAVTAVPAADIAATFDRLADRWDGLAGEIRPDVRSVWVRRIDRVVAAGEPVVELGCGTGVPVGWLLDGRYRYIGVDVSRRMIERAGSVLPKAALSCADMTSVEFPAESLGAVVAFGSIEHVPRELHAGLLDEVTRWLRPGGVLVGSLTAVDTPSEVVTDWLGAGPMSWSGHDAETNLELLAASGLTVADAAALEQTDAGGRRRQRLWFVARRDAAAPRPGRPDARSTGEP